MRIPCTRCSGFDHLCEACLGSGLEDIRRCPWALDLGSAFELLWLHSLWPERLPREGGLFDQSARYVDAMRILDKARAQLMETIKPEEKHG